MMEAGSYLLKCKEKIVRRGYDQSKLSRRKHGFDQHGVSHLAFGRVLAMATRSNIVI